MLAASGYKAGEAVSAESMSAIMFLIAGVPVIFHGISLVLLMMFKLTSEQARAVEQPSLN